ncbi:GNAT family N-acetyltransferase [Thalassomonas viridans]|uniref:GNAT family N-acetyltransferase n=1 Tax=Thalassomonas viridans TaxID=137584 RepID=A0AAE9Z492_9GAMM|nr:GNAT family N-acetyltransferase [Thalassomonas viridans]WDE05779.1 GNAT family N-acetyltransferase [Thalassomonas viridans]
MTINIRNYHPGDARALTDIFYTSIHQVACQYYTQAEINQWAPLPIDYPYWQTRFDRMMPYVAELDNRVVGFMTLAESGLIDLAYSHPDYQKKGIATALHLYLEKQARQQGIKSLTVNASYLARPFFAKQGFRVLVKNEIPRNGEVLINWSMEKHLV